VGRTPWSAADALFGLLPSRRILIPGRQRVRGDPRGPGGPPHNITGIAVEVTLLATHPTYTSTPRSLQFTTFSWTIAW
jgi:hypothetical protein